MSVGRYFKLLKCCTFWID